MDVFKTKVGIFMEIPISQENYYKATGGLAPFVVELGSRAKPTCYAVCPECDSPIQLIGLNRQQEDARPLHPYGRHVRHDVAGVAGYDEAAYLACPYSAPSYGRDAGRRPPSSPTGMALYRLMRARFDRVEYAWRLSSGIWLDGKALGHALTVWRNDEEWLNYGSTYSNLPQMLFLGHAAQSLYRQCVLKDGRVASLLSGVRGIRLEPVTFSDRYARVTTTRYLDVTFTVGVPKPRVIDEHLTWTFLLGVNVGPRQLDRIEIHTDPEWFGNILSMDTWHDNRRLLDIAARILS